MKLTQPLVQPGLIRRSLVLAGVMILLGCAQKTSAQYWNASPSPSPNSNIYYNGGNVGIGATSPVVKFQVESGSIYANAGTTNTVFSGSVSGNSTASLIGPSGYWAFRTDTSSRLNLDVYNSGSPLAALTVAQNGYVGIGIANPPQKFNIWDTPNDVGLGLYTSGASTAVLGAESAAWKDIDLAFYTQKTTGGNSYAERMRVTSTGNVGIGTSSPPQKFNVWDTPNDVGLGLYTSGASTAVLGAESAAWKDIDLAFYTQKTTGGNSYAERMRVTSTGKVGIGTPTPGSTLEVVGDISVIGTGNITAAHTITGGNIVAKYQDVAEWVPASEQLPASTVVVLDSTKSNRVISSTQSYDTRVAGVVSAQPGIALGESGPNKVLVATTGRVLVKVDASRAPIHIGDLLVTSDVPGVAMKSEPVNLGGVQLHRPGTLIGKALEPQEKGSGRILVLLSLQ